MHPLVAAWIDSMARKMRVERSMLHDAVEGRPIPEWFAMALAKGWGPSVKLEHFEIEPLTSQHGDNTIPTVDTSTSVLRSRGVRRSKGAPETKATKATSAANVTFAEIAKGLTAKLGRSISVNSVQAWHKKKDDPAYRRTPDDAATAMQELWGIPRSVWPGIIPPK